LLVQLLLVTFQVLQLGLLLHLLFQLVQLEHLVAIVFFVQDHVGPFEVHLRPSHIARFEQVQVSLLIVFKVHVDGVYEFSLYGGVCFVFN
jgi:hypothetical protein